MGPGEIIAGPTAHGPGALPALGGQEGAFEDFLGANPESASSPANSAGGKTGTVATAIVQEAALTVMPITPVTTHLGAAARKARPKSETEPQSSQQKPADDSSNALVATLAALAATPAPVPKTLLPTMASPEPDASLPGNALATSSNPSLPPLKTPEPSAPLAANAPVLVPNKPLLPLTAVKLSLPPPTNEPAPVPQVTKATALSQSQPGTEDPSIIEKVAAAGLKPPAASTPRNPVRGSTQPAVAHPAGIASLRQSSAAIPAETAPPQTAPISEVSPHEPLSKTGIPGATQAGVMSTKAYFQEASNWGNSPGNGGLGTVTHPTAPAMKAPALVQPGSVQQPTVQVAPVVANPLNFAARADGVVAPKKASVQPAGSQVLTQVMESATRMTSDGQSNVKVQVKLDDGQELTVKLQMTQGAVHAVFKTESPELKQAIEQNWAGFRTDASERGLEIAAPVFESPSSDSGFGSLPNHEQPQQSTPDPESFETTKIPSTPAAVAQPVTQTQSRAASETEGGVNLYA
jgi:hypothetical protein